MTEKQWPVLDKSRLQVLQDLGEAAAGRRLLASLIAIFVSEGLGTLAALSEACSRGDRHSLVRLAHKFKGSSAQLGGEAVRQLCEALEEQGTLLPPQQLASQLALLEPAFKELVKELHAYLEC